MSKKKAYISEYERRSAERIKSIIDEFCDGKQQILADKAGLSKVNISQYVNMYNTPASFSAKKIAAPFGLSAAWVMGFDCPKYYDPIDPYAKAFTGEVAELLECYNKLSPENKGKLMEIAKLYAMSEEGAK